jgi:hypothetical protein
MEMVEKWLLTCTVPSTAESTSGLLSGVDLLDLGPRRLRDLPIPVGVFQVRAAGLRTDFPPLRALDAGPGNLRPPAMSFIGRESEVADVQAALRSHRLVTLTGVGGLGKTRLAVEVAARLADEFPDGVSPLGSLRAKRSSETRRTRPPRLHKQPVELVSKDVSKELSHIVWFCAEMATYGGIRPRSLPEVGVARYPFTGSQRRYGTCWLASGDTIVT